MADLGEAVSRSFPAALPLSCLYLLLIFISCVSNIREEALSEPYISKYLFVL